MEGIGTVRYPRLIPRDVVCAGRLKKRTLTNLYNERPTWLDLTHRKLDDAVFAAYGWSPSLSATRVWSKVNAWFPSQNNHRLTARGRAIPFS